jgi:cholesterol transport system auxiliary component
LALTGSLTLSVALAGCVTLFPTTKPAQLYRFDVAASEAPQAAGAAAPFSVYRAPTNFNRGADGDRILTMTGDQAAYVAEARWIAPASVLFDEAESHAFDQSSGSARLGRRGELVSAPVSLRLDVEAFETRYADAPGGAPTVVIRVRANLTHIADRKALAVRMFESRKKVDDNRVSAIVPGYDAAVTDVLSQIVTWTNAEASKQPSVP